MDHQTAAPPPPSIPTTTAGTTNTAAAYPDSLDSSPRSRNTDSWGEDTINNNNNNNNQNATMQPPPPQQLTKLRLMCSYGGHIVPRPHDKSLCYVGGDTRIVVVDRHTTLSDLTNRLSKTLIRSSSNNSLSSSTVSISVSTSQTTPFTLKYQLPSEDLDSLISVTTDEDLENMIDEYERLLSSNSSSRLRLFLFPLKPESVNSIGSLLENTTKSEDWFLNALNGTTSGFSDTSSVNCLLGLDDDVLVNDKKDVKKPNNQNNNNSSSNGNNLGQDVHSVPDLERTSSFGSASSSPSLASLPPIKVHVDENKAVPGIEEQFVQMNLQQQQQSVAVPVPVVVTGVPMSTNSPLAQTAYDLASQDSVLSDGRQKPGMIYQDQLVQMQVNSNNNRNPEMSNLQDQNARIQMQQQQQQMADSAYLMSMGNTQAGDSQHTQMLHQQPQFIHTGVPQPQYIHHHPSGAVPMTSYYQMYPPQSQHHPHHAPLDQQNFVYYMPAPVPARQAPQGYNMQMHQQQQQQQGSGYAEVSNAGAMPLSHSQAPQTGYTTSRPAQTGTKSELPAGVYATTSSGNPQFVQVPSSQHQPQVQPQYVGYSQMHHPSQSVASSASGASAGANYGYEFTDPAQGQHIYYAAQPLPPQSTTQYQTVTGEQGSYLPTDASIKQQQQQQGRGQQP
uniref:putative uncharacterized protein DDB_G0274535 n=1 Tax=Erigeron canadensis TaxID=72917 RepID=UPI001CB8B0E4|nr:putative uncharacterized protein DDB_G0274535 [Erigeron canadensis]